MNNTRRKSIAKLIKNLELLKTNDDCEWLTLCVNALENIKSEEEEAFNNMPEGLQCSSRGMDAEMAIDNLEEAVTYLQELIDIEDDGERETNIDMAIDCLEDAGI